MRRADSITARLIVGLVGGLMLVWLLTAATTVLIMRGQLEQTLDGGLRETAERMLPLVVDALVDSDAGEAAQHQSQMQDTEGGEYVVYQARGQDGSLLMRSHDAPDAPFAAPLSEGFASVLPWRIYTTVDAAAGIYVQVAEAEARRNQAVWQSAGVMGVPVLLLIPLGALVVLLSVRRGLAPLRELDRDVSKRDAANLTLLPEADVPAELRPIRDAINGLLARLRAVVEAERALAANSAHELRTPIAASLAQTQRLVEELDGHPAQLRAKNVEHTLHRMAALAAKLLALSRAEAQVARLAEPIDLLPGLRLTVTDAQRSLGPRVTLASEPGARLFAQLDLDAFGIVVRNLIENADKHGLPGGAIEVVAGDNVLEVSSEGPVVSGDRLAVLARRFERGDSASSGAGLGLAIVDTIVRQVGGRLELQSPARGRADGFTARIRLAGF